MKQFILFVCFFLYSTNLFSEIDEICGIWINYNFYVSLKENKSLQKAYSSSNSYPNYNIQKVRKDSIIVLLSDFHDCGVDAYNRINADGNSIQLTNSYYNSNISFKILNEKIDNFEIIEINGYKYIQIDQFESDYTYEKYINKINSTIQTFTNHILFVSNYYTQSGDTVKIDKDCYLTNISKNYKLKLNFDFEFFEMDYDHVMTDKKEYPILAFNFKNNKLFFYKVTYKNNKYIKSKRALFILTKY